MVFFELFYAMVVLYIVMGSLNDGSFKYFNNGMLEVFILDIAGIPVISILFIRSYCITELVAVSRIMTLWCKFSIVSFNGAFSSRRFLIIMFFILMISYRKLWKFPTKSFRSFDISSVKLQLVLVSVFVASSDVLLRVDIHEVETY